MRKPIFTTAAAAITLAVITATPAQARYLQTDPIGYEDNINLYTYVANDPVNYFDPTGLCAETTDADGNVIQLGICSDNEELQGIVDQQLADPNSNVINTENMLVAQGLRVDAVADVNGGALESSVVIAGPAKIDDVADPGEVIIGMQESTTLGFVGDSRVETEIPFTVTDAVNHEFGSHIFDQLTGKHPDFGSGVIEASGVEVPEPFGRRESRAINRTNNFRRNSGSPYQRSRSNR